MGFAFTIAVIVLAPFHERPAPDEPSSTSRVRSMEVRVRARDATLAARIFLPGDRGPHPGIVLIPSAFSDDAAGSRDSLRGPAEDFAREGLAVMTYDRRGGHGSTGDAGELRFDRLADDALAAVECLASRKEIDAGRIGVCGYSNSGWIAALAASRSPRVSFVVNLVCAPIAPWRVELSRVQTQMRGDGYWEEDIDRATAFMQLRFEVARTGRRWDELQKLQKEIQSEPWYVYLDPTATLEDLKRQWRDYASYDPLPAWERLKVPVLVVFGEFDWSYRIKDCIYATKQALDVANNRNYAVVVIPQADQLLCISENGGRREFNTPRPFAPGVWEIVHGWIHRQIGQD